MKTRALIAALVLVTSLPALADSVKKHYRSEQRFTLAPGGSLVLENPFGNIDIVGSEQPEIVVITITTISGVSNAAVDEGRRQTTLAAGGDERTRILRATVGPGNGREWSSTVEWRIRLPRNAHVRVASRVSERLRVFGVDGSVHIKNFNGNILLHEAKGHAVIDSVNGSIIYSTNTQPTGNVILKTLNGHVTATVPPNADLRWVAETVKGDIRTNLPARGAFFGATFRGSVNAPGGVTLTTATLMGNIQLLAAGTSFRDAQSLRQLPATIVPAPASRKEGVIRRETVKGMFTYSTNIGDIRVQEIHGDADVHTGAGEVQLGSVTGECKVSSLGGPLQIGEVHGAIEAKTRAGDILIDSARRGGTVVTNGGSIRLLYTGGPTRLVSGGGNITVRQAAGSINAFTRSGDIEISVGVTVPTQKIEARTDKGNVVLNVGPNFAADIDAVIMTSDPAADTILSDIPGLSISRQQVGGKTRVRATGKLNGGGSPITISATEGDIRISTRPAGPTVVQPR
jgi:DUF4097 and DUF4098 domain-containing protein YvlB